MSLSMGFLFGYMFRPDSHISTTQQENADDNPCLEIMAETVISQQIDCKPR